MNCAEAREMLPAYAGDRDASLSLRRHLARCPACRAEAAGYDDLLATMARLPHTTADPPHGLIEVLVAIGSSRSRTDHVRSHIVRNRNVYVGGVAVALAGAAGAALWRVRRHRLLAA